MKFLVSIDTNIFQDRTLAAGVVRALLQGVMLQNAALFRAAKIPRLYESGVTYENPSLGANGEQHLENAAIVVARGSGSCPELSAWRAAELRTIGDPKIRVRPCVFRNGRCVSHAPIQVLGRVFSGCPDVKIYWRPETRIYHCEVRLPSGDAEDPSRFLGMKGSAA